MIQSTKDGARLAKRAFIILGIIYIIFAVSDLIPSLAIISLLMLPLKIALVGTVAFSLSSSSMFIYAILLAGVFLLIAGHLIAKRNIMGVYLGWLFILVGVVTILGKISMNVIPLIVLMNLIYVNYRAHKTLQSEQNSTQA